jgi:CCR4-NOT transcriptional regulation complex NOT5 subunit
MDILERLETFVSKKNFSELEKRVESVLDICVEHFKETAERCEELEDTIENLEYKIEELKNIIKQMKNNETI